MGQYYYPTILRKKGKRYFSEQFYSHQYGNGLKLMEHSYIGNNFVETVLEQLYCRPGRLAWIGDYHEKGDIQDKELEKVFYRHYKKFHKNDEFTHVEEATKRAGRFILNHDKKCFIDMQDYEQKAFQDEWGCKVHPIPLLTSVGNGRGGGDYWNEEDSDELGTWAGDLLEVQDVRPNGYADFTNMYDFKERG